MQQGVEPERQLGEPVAAFVVGELPRCAHAACFVADLFSRAGELNGGISARPCAGVFRVINRASESAEPGMRRKRVEVVRRRRGYRRRDVGHEYR